MGAIHTGKQEEETGCIPRETLCTEKAGKTAFQVHVADRQWLSAAFNSRDVGTGVQQKLVCWSGMRRSGAERSSLHLSEEGTMH